MSCMATAGCLGSSGPQPLSMCLVTTGERAVSRAGMRAGTSQPGGLDPATLLTNADFCSLGKHAEASQSWPCCVTHPCHQQLLSDFSSSTQDPCSYGPECPQATAGKSWYPASVKRSTTSHPKSHPEWHSWPPAASWPRSLLGPVMHSRLQGGNLQTGQEAAVRGSSLKWPSRFGRRDLAGSAAGICPGCRC